MNEPEKKPVSKSPSAQIEEKILASWKENDIFKKTLEKEAPQGDFVFYEGPPTANGKPGIHHLEARAFKDIIPRYKTMRGFHVTRKGGWDTQGLPVELQVEKKLGLKSKKEIEAYGVEKFNAQCKESVWEYVDLWKQFTDRIGYWIDQENPYVTYEKTYMESVWNILKTVSEQKVGGVLGVGGKPMLYKDYKVVPWCPRCGTALSSHELAQGYEDVKDLSVYVKFKLKNPTEIGLSGDAYFLAWTTTPWTLPGNVGLAVGEDTSYVFVEHESQIYILAESLLQKIFNEKDFKNIKTVLGKDLVGLQYEPLFPYLVQKFGDKNPEAFAQAYKVYPADFVTTTDGTGIVHTAVMYGQEDFELGTKVGLPKFHLVREDGHFIDDMDFLSGRFVKEKNQDGKPTLDVDIISDLKTRNLFFAQENIKHTYPHCWRCKTPLIYYARDSWYIRMSALRDKLVAENEKINWEPGHIKEGRFGEWLREAKDWAISRERYWGTPLPIWTNEEGKMIVIGSVSDLKTHIPKRNNFILVRHGQSESNVQGVINCNVHTKDSLTSDGLTQAQKAGKILVKEKIDVIITSPFARAQETAKIIAQEIGFSGDIISDDRIGELQVGAWNEKTWSEYETQFKNLKERFTKHPHAEKSEGGVVENWEDARRRVAEFMYDIDAQFEGKNILLVGHGGTLNLIALSSLGYSVEEIAFHYYDNSFSNAEVRKIDWRALPHNALYEIDLHKPFIDSVELVDEAGNKLTRVKEVLDVWFDSGAMPFAQNHFPFSKNTMQYPADFISEAVDQTRGWFYTLLAIGVLMEKGSAYKNVICLGHILDAQGKKMSKSLGNIVDPWIMIDKYGVDALRLWMYGVNRPGDSKNFDEQTVDEIVKKVFNPLSNIFSFYEMYADKSVTSRRDSTHVLDRWILARLDELILQGTRHLDEFQVFEASRSIRDFIGDFSTWYIRRSRDRFKSDDIADKKASLNTTHFVLLSLAKYMAPFAPFFAEELYRKMNGEKESVHLDAWPEVNVQAVGDVMILEDMKEVRELSSRGLELRNTAGIKVRQPLSKFTIKSARLEGRNDLLSLVAEELNVKEVVFDASLENEAQLDTTLTEALKTEGRYREVVRAVQDLRKKTGLEPHDSARLLVKTNAEGKSLIEQYKKDLSSTSLLKEIVYQEVGGDTFSVDNLSFVFVVEKIV